MNPISNGKINSEFFNGNGNRKRISTSKASLRYEEISYEQFVAQTLKNSSSLSQKVNLNEPAKLRKTSEEAKFLDLPLKDYTKIFVAIVDVGNSRFFPYTKTNKIKAPRQFWPQVHQMVKNDFPLVDSYEAPIKKLMNIWEAFAKNFDYQEMFNLGLILKDKKFIQDEKKKTDIVDTFNKKVLELCESKKMQFPELNPYLLGISSNIISISSNYETKASNEELTENKKVKLNFNTINESAQSSLSPLQSSGDEVFTLFNQLHNHPEIFYNLELEDFKTKDSAEDA